jgi:DNA-directed RNA polymerase subunit K/omega
MVIRPPHLNAYEFVVVSSLRAKQLLAGCIAHFAEPHNAATMAQMEVAAGRIARINGENDSTRQSG